MNLVSALGVPAPQTMGETFDVLARSGVLSAELAKNLRRAVGFRNVAVHDYQALNWLVVHGIVRSHLDDFSALARAVMTRLG